MSSALYASRANTYGDQSQLSHGIDGRTTKRRRLDADDATQNGHVSGVPQWQQPYSDAQVASPYASVGAEQSHVQVYRDDTPTMNHVGWQQNQEITSGGYVGLYDNVPAPQQPYYQGQTDPSVYNSPWPPQDQDLESASDTYVAHSQTAFNGNNSSAYAPAPGYATTSQALGIDQFALSHDPDQARRLQLLQETQPRPIGSPVTVTYVEDASMHMKLQSLPILENLATHLIHTIAQYNLSQVQELMQKTDDEESQAYNTLKNLFDQTRKVYSRETVFIDAIAIQMFQPDQQEIIRKANIASFVSAILGAHDLSFYHLNEYFLETFVPLGHRLLKWQGVIYLELKTQSYISALMNSDGASEPMLDELFPSDLDSRILTRHPDAPSLSPSEQDFLDRCKARKAYLMAEPASENLSSDLPNKYQWKDFIRDFAAAISKHVDSILSTSPRAHVEYSGVANHDLMQSTYNDGFGIMDPRSQADSTPADPSSAQPQYVIQPPTTQPQTSRTAQTSTTVRQAWSKAEEEALVSGLEQVSGPHWSQILALYGRGGSISEVLKDRNQVQLKDKARNLKLWYLKTGRELPVAFRGVTGELRKRGGARARAALLAEENAVAGALGSGDELSEREGTPAARKGRSQQA